MKKIHFYRGFEGEEEILICSSDIELRIWDGYFELIMEIMFDLELECFEEAFGLAAQWCICKDWCEKTEIDDLDREIFILHQIDFDKLNHEKYHYLTVKWCELKEIFVELLSLFEHAKLYGEKVYIIEL